VAAKQVTPTLLWSKGDPCEARSKLDDLWYKGRILDITPAGTRFLVRFEDYNSEEEVALADLRPPPLEQNQTFDLGFTANLQIDRFMKKLYPDRYSEPPKQPAAKVNLEHEPVANVSVRHFC